MTAVAFEVCDDQVLAFYEYDEVEDGVKSKAELWYVIEEGDGYSLSLEEASYNEAVVEPVSDLDTDDVSTQDDDPCGGCTGGAPGGDRGQELRDQCRATVVLRCATNAAACGGCGFLCPWSGTTCAACLLAVCSSAFNVCCDEYSSVCADCGTTL